MKPSTSALGLPHVPRLSARTPRSPCLVALFFFLAWPALARELVVFHFNDAHGYIFSRSEDGKVAGGMGLFAGALARERAAARRRGAASVLLFGGDMFQGTAVVEATRGACMVDL